MRSPLVARVLKEVDQGRLRDMLFDIADQPIPFRKLNLTLPGHAKNTLYEADDYIKTRLRKCGLPIRTESMRVQAFRCDKSKPKAQQYSRPAPEDPWYDAFNIYAEHRGGSLPKEIILLCAHKDSQSWVHSPGAYDNGVGTVALLEIARIISALETQRTIRFLFCNEEHTPWTSVLAARNARQRNDDLRAVINVDSIGGKSQADIDAGRKTNATLYTVDEGRSLAERMSQVNETYRIGLQQKIVKRTRPGDDDGSFVKAGFGRTVANLGSCPYADPEYHREGDVPDRVDFVNVRLATQMVLAAVLEEDRL